MRGYLGTFYVIAQFLCSKRSSSVAQLMHESGTDCLAKPFLTYSILSKSKSFGEKISCVGSVSVNGPVSYYWTDPPASSKLWTKDSNVKTFQFDIVRFWS